MNQVQFLIFRAKNETNNSIFNSFWLLMQALITRLSVFGTCAVLMNIDELLFIAWVWSARRRKHRVYPNMRGVYYVVTGVYTTEAEIQVVVLGFFRISQWIDCTKSICLRKKAIILECIDTYRSIIHFLVLENRSKQFRRSALVSQDHINMSNISTNLWFSITFILPIITYCFHY